MANSTVENMNIFNSLFALFRSDFKIDNVKISNITLETGATGRILRAETNSVGTIQNSSFEDINFSIMTVTQSSIQILDSYMNNITASRYIVE